MKTILNKIIVEPKPAEEKTASGIIIPGTAQEKPQEGTVIAVGSGTDSEPMEVKVGDKILKRAVEIGEVKTDYEESPFCLTGAKVKSGGKKIVQALNDGKTVILKFGK